MPDTATTLVNLYETKAKGLYHLDGNPGMSLYEIGLALRALLNAPWQVGAVEEPHMTLLMSDQRVAVTSIRERLEKA